MERGHELVLALEGNDVDSWIFEVRVGRHETGLLRGDDQRGFGRVPFDLEVVAVPDEL